MTFPIRRTDLEAQLPTRYVGRPLYWSDRLDSTNRVLLSWAQRGASEGTLLVADEQSAGRGRHGRRWAAPPGTGLLMSLLLHPRRPFSLIPLLTGVVMAEAIEALTPLAVTLKWPNDLLIHGRKVGGILAEATTVQHHPRLVVGVGLDVNMTAAQIEALGLPATSLLIESGRSIERERLLLEILPRWEAAYEAWQRGTWSLDEWRRRAPMLGQMVTISGHTRRWEGIAEDVADDGALLVRDRTGHMHRLYAGDVTLHLNQT